MTEVDPYTPEFTLEEKDEEILIVIVAPLAKPKEAAFVLEKNIFTFESPPYCLKIKLPHPVSDRFSQQAYDRETKTYKIKLKKICQPDDSQQEDSDEDIIPVKHPQGGKSENGKNENKEKQFYGFANMYSNMFGEIYSEFSEVISLPDPDYTEVSERTILRRKEENEKWDEDHYLADTMETDHLEDIFKYKPPWISSPLKDEFRNDENEMLREIINESKIGKLSEDCIRLSEFQLVDILYSYAYNVRTTEGENTVESGWTVNKLSSTLSWFEVFEDLKAVLLSCYRRCLIFPLYRSWSLAEMIHKDVVSILRAGPKQVTRCLLEIMDVFNDSGYRYILNSLYVNDLCNFAFHMTDERCLALSENVENISIRKYEVNPELPLVEIAAHLALEEETEDSNKTEANVKNIVEKIASMKLGCKRDDPTDSSETDSEESDSTESSDNED